MNALRLLHLGISNPRAAVATAVESGEFKDVPAAVSLFLFVGASTRIAFGFMQDQGLSMAQLLMGLVADTSGGLVFVVMIAGALFFLSGLWQRQSQPLPLLLGLLLSFSPMVLMTAFALVCGMLGDLLLGSVSAQILFNWVFAGLLIWVFVLMSRAAYTACGFRYLHEGMALVAGSTFLVLGGLCLCGFGMVLSLILGLSS